MEFKYNLEIPDFMEAREAAEKWGISDSRIRQRIDEIPYGQKRKFGKQWVFTREGMEAVFGEMKTKEEFILIKETFNNVVVLNSELFETSVYMIQLKIGDFAKSFNVPVKFIDPAPETSNQHDLSIIVNLTGTIASQGNSIDVEGEAVIIDGIVKLERRLHPETQIILSLYDNLNDDQVRGLLGQSNRIIK